MLTSNWATFTLSLSATENSVSSLSCLLCLYRMQSHVFLPVFIGISKALFNSGFRECYDFNFRDIFRNYNIVDFIILIFLLVFLFTLMRNGVKMVLCANAMHGTIPARVQKG